MSPEHLPDCGPEVLDILHNALTRARGRRLAFLLLLYSDSSSDLVSLPPPPAGKDVAGPEAGAVELSQREESILRVLARAERPLKGCTTATRAGLRYNSHFRDVMSELREKGLVIVDADRRYWSADKPLPKGCDDKPSPHKPTFVPTGKGDEAPLTKDQLAERIAAARQAKANGHVISD